MKTQLVLVSEVSQWPEFVAFVKRLGVDTSKPISSLVIEMPSQDSMVKLTIVQNGIDSHKEVG